MFDSIYSAVVTPAQFFTMAAAALITGFLYSWIMSFRVRSTKRFFTVAALIPFVVGAVITFVNGNIGAGVAIGGAFGLIRFRSAPGSADEIAAILVAMGSGIAFGMGYLAYGVVILLGMAPRTLTSRMVQPASSRGVPSIDFVSVRSSTR